jgi:gamma-glutamylcyclotransferase (GGCT)/AIG2-like uncharacterized protein YtfP
MIDGNQSKVDVCQSLFNCLNKIQTELVQTERLHLREGEAFSKMILNILDENPASEDFLLNSTEIQKFSELIPPILDHSVLRKGKYRPDRKMSQELATKSSEQHRILKQFVKKYHNTEIAPHEVLKQTSRVLYVIRSNIAHGEKTPYGPDLQKVKRDQIVSEVTIPLQILLIDLLLNRPSEKFVSYGTLLPQGSNQSILSQLQGSWEKCSIQGTIEKDDYGLLLFKWDLSGEVNEAQLFSSEKLPEKWAELDRFEGNQYKRRLIPVRRSDGKIRIANIYVKNQAS